MNNNILPDLSTWYEVPVGATIPARMLCVTLSPNGSFTFSLTEQEVHPHNYETRYFTPEPVELPNRPLPEKIGSIIQHVVTDDGKYWDYGFLVEENAPVSWLTVSMTVSDDGYFFTGIYKCRDIIGWEPARIVPTGVGVLDETDKRPRIDSDDNEWEWWPKDVWCCVDGFRGYFGNLAKINAEFGPLRFAEEDPDDES